MLGDKIGQETGKVISQRVLPNPGGGPKMETSFRATGTLFGVKETVTGTYVADVRPDGTLFGDGNGIVMGSKGETATWTGSGVGTIRKDGSVSYRGAIYYQSSSSKWTRLNRVAAVFEYEVDAEGNTVGHVWEWK
jgi:hypothetical protein